MSDAGPLRIGIVAPLWAPVPPVTYGGIERHLHLLIEELVHRGHDVTLFASGDSRTSASLRPACPRNVAALMESGEACFYEHYINESLALALEASEGLDVLHLHLGTAPVPLMRAARAAVVHSIHTGITPDDVGMLQRNPEAHVTALSRRQIDPIPATRRERVRIVPYGIDFAAHATAEGPGEHLVFLGRMAPHKGPDEAIRIARAAGRPIRLAGAPVTAEDRDWFEREIRPQIDGTQVVWVGAVDDRAKDELFHRALALLFPIRWEEPFGLVMLEALARGVPVLACQRGSVAEVVDVGATGWHAESPDALVKFADDAARLDRKAVREHAQRRFSVASMVDAYLDVYRDVLAAGPSR